MAEKRNTHRLKVLLSLLFAAQLLSGCLVSKEVYQTEYVRARDVEAKNEDLAARLKSETEALAAQKVKLSELEGKLEAKEGELKSALAALEGSEKALDTCRQEREAYSGDLDKAGQTGKAQAAEIKTLRDRAALLEDDLKRCASGKDSQTQGREAVIEALRSKIFTLEAERDVLTEAKEKALREKAEMESRTGPREALLEELRTRISTIEAERDVLAQAKAKAEAEKEAKLDEVSKTYDSLLEGMKKEVDEGQVVISKLKGQLSVKLTEEVLFASGSAQVKPEGRAILDSVGKALKEEKTRALLIEGHTDNIPIKGPLAEKFPTNWDLSAARAVSVVRYLSEKAGLEKERLGAVGYGEYRPAADNSTKEGRARNRRIEIKLVPLVEEGE